MKTLIVYYSFEGNTEHLAEALAKHSGADLLALKPLKEKESKGFSKFVWGGYQAVMKKKPELKPYEFKASDYDLIVFASPVWAGTYAPPLRTFFENEDIIAKNVAYFYTHQGGPGKVKSLFDEVLVDNHILGSLDLVMLKTDKNRNEEILYKWFDNLTT
jgi:flavodoxin